MLAQLRYVDGESNGHHMAINSTMNVSVGDQSEPAAMIRVDSKSVASNAHDTALMGGLTPQSQRDDGVAGFDSPS